MGWLKNERPRLLRTEWENATMLAQEFYAILGAEKTEFDGPLIINVSGNDPGIIIKGLKPTDDANIVFRRNGEDDLTIGLPAAQTVNRSGNTTVLLPHDALIITARNQTKSYGETFTWLGNEFEISSVTYSIEPLRDVNGNLILDANGNPIVDVVGHFGPWVKHRESDRVDSAKFNSPGSINTAEVGTYAIGVGEADGFGVGGGLSDYDLKYKQGILTVTLAALTITADDQTKTQGDTFTWVGDEFTTSGLVSPDWILSCTFSSAGADAGAAVGTYPIIVSAAVGSGLDHYTIDYVAGTLTVEAAPPTFPAKQYSAGPSVFISHPSPGVHGHLAAKSYCGPIRVTLDSPGVYCERKENATALWRVLLQEYISDVSSSYPTPPLSYSVVDSGTVAVNGILTGCPDAITYAGQEFVVNGGDPDPGPFVRSVFYVLQISDSNGNFKDPDSDPFDIDNPHDCGLGSGGSPC